MRRRALSISFRGKLGWRRIFSTRSGGFQTAEGKRAAPPSVVHDKKEGKSCAVGRDSVEPKTLTAPQSVALPSEQSDVRRFPSTPRFPPCAPQGSALTLRRVMRLLLRRVGLTLAAGLLIFCCSCERHRVGELPAEHHTKSSEIDTTKPDAAPSPAARSSPANFFPDKRKP